MKTRIATIILALLALATSAQAATGYGVYIAGVEVTSDNYKNLASIDGVSVGTGGRIYYSPSKSTLYLRNVSIYKSGKIGIYNESCPNLIIVFEEYFDNEGSNKGCWIESMNNPAIQLDKRTFFKSEGKGHGIIRCGGNSDDLYLSNSLAIAHFTNVDITFDGDDSYGIRGNNNGEIIIENSSVVIWAGTEDRKVEAVKDLRELTIEGASTVTLHGNNSTQTVSGLIRSYLTDMTISSPSGASFSSTLKTFCTSNGQAIKGDIKFTTTAIPINSTNFPDNNFLNFVSDLYDSDNNGYLTAAERTTQGIDVSGMGNIKKLNGIEYFADLMTLDCHNNQIGTLDLRQNTKLKTLLCYGNQLTSLNLSGNTLLEELRCNNNQLTSLNLNNNSKLTKLLCSDNKLTSLNLTYNTLLSTLDCSNNQLTLLNLTYNTKLQSIRCYGNNLSTLTMGGSSYPNLNYFILDQNSQNQTLSFDTHQAIVNKLPTISSGVTATIDPGYYISKADVTKARNIGWTVLTSGLEAYKLSDIIPNTNFRDYVSSLSCCKFGWLLQTQANNITQMNVSSKSISDLTGISYFPSLQTLNCQNNTLTSLNVSSLTNLQYLYCYGNRLTSLSLSSNNKLVKVECQNNQLTSLTLPSSSTSLSEVRCYGNKLKGSYMTNTVSSLPYRNTQGSLYVATAASTEGNALNAQQRATLKSKKWSAYYLNSNNTWVPYEEGIVTGVEGVENEQQANEDTPQYNLQGQCVGNGYHGIVVRNGRKVLVK